MKCTAFGVLLLVAAIGAGHSGATAADPPSPTDSVQNRAAPPLVGIGLALKPPPVVNGEQRVQGSAAVMQLVPNRPAQLCGEIEVGDLIVAVAQGEEGPTPVAGLLFTEVIQLIRGPADSEVRLTIVPHRNRFVKSKVVAINREFLVETDLIGRTVPDAELLILSGGERRSLESFRGSAVVLEFWTASCAPCRAHIAELQELRARNPAWSERATLITVNVDDVQETAEQAIAEVDWPQTLNTWGNVDARNAFRADIVPLVVVVNREGMIVAAGNPRSVNVERIVNDLITETKNAL